MINIILAAVHIALCLLVFLGIKNRVLCVNKYMFFVALFLPFWGVMVILILHFKLAFDPSDAADITVENMKLESELYRSVTVDEKKSDMAVPIEEALLINSARDRRMLIMDVLNDNPGDYIEFLQKAGNNDDTEVVHYAVTAMVEISKENDYMLQTLGNAYEAEPDNIEVLTKYINFLWRCLSQNMMQGQVEIMNRAIFSRLIKQKIEVGGELRDYSRYAENELKLKHFDAAGEIISSMSEKWSDSEEYILLNLQYLASLNKGQEIEAFIAKVENSKIYLSSKTKEALSFWTN